MSRARGRSVYRGPTPDLPHRRPLRERFRTLIRETRSVNGPASLERPTAAADRRQEMDFAIRLQSRAKTARGHDVVDGNLQARSQGILPAETRLDARKSAIQGVNHFADRAALDGHLDRAAGQVAQRCRD